MALYSVPEDKAHDLLDTQPISNLRMLLEAAGYIYLHQARRWVQTPHI